MPDEIIPRLYLGDLFHVTDESILTRLGITHVVSVLETSPSFNFTNGLGDRLIKLHISLRDISFVNAKDPEQWHNSRSRGAAGGANEIAIFYQSNLINLI